MKNCPRERSGLTMIESGSFTPGRRTSMGTPLSGIDVAQGDGRLQVAELRHLLAGDLQNLVAHAKIGLPGGLARKDLRRSRTAICSTPRRKRHHRHQEGEDDVHDHAGRDDGHAFGHALGQKAAGIVEGGIGDWGLGIRGWWTRDWE